MRGHHLLTLTHSHARPHTIMNVHPQAHTFPCMLTQAHTHTHTHFLHFRRLWSNAWPSTGQDMNPASVSSLTPHPHLLAGSPALTCWLAPVALGGSPGVARRPPLSRPSEDKQSWGAAAPSFGPQLLPIRKVGASSSGVRSCGGLRCIFPTHTPAQRACGSPSLRCPRKRPRWASAPTRRGPESLCAPDRAHGAGGMTGGRTRPTQSRPPGTCGPARGLNTEQPRKPRAEDRRLLMTPQGICQARPAQPWEAKLLQGWGG